MSYEPLQKTFVADPPSDEAVSLINILQRQCEVSEAQKKAVLKACKFIVENNEVES